MYLLRELTLTLQSQPLVNHSKTSSLGNLPSASHLQPRLSRTNTQTPAQWRASICSLSQQILEQKVVSADVLLHEIRKYLNRERYGFNGDIILCLATFHAPINAVIVFRGIKCTVLHSIVSMAGDFPISRKRPLFAKYLRRTQPILDVADECGRTALILAVWNLSKTKPKKAEVNVIRCLLDYGFSPFLTFRGLTVADKLSKICIVLQNSEENNVKGSRRRRRVKGKGGGFVNTIRNTSKCIASLTELSLKVHGMQRKMEAIEWSLEWLIRRKLLIGDIAELLLEYIGITNYVQRRKMSMKQLRQKGSGRLRPLKTNRR